MLSQAIEQLSSSEDEDPSDSTAGIDVLRMIIVNNKFIYMYVFVVQTAYCYTNG